MKTVKDVTIQEMEIKKSKFISYIYPVSTVCEVEDVLISLRKEHKDANHITYAYVLYSPTIEKCSDDGEPSGTAGKPILDIIKRNNLANVLIVVVRYFGGVKLGAGGLCRAYSNSAKIAVETSNIVELKHYVLAKIYVSIDNKYLIEKYDDIKILDIDYSNISNKQIVYLLAILENSETMNLVKGIAIKFCEVEKKLM